jgi:hypothetical protein
MLLEDNASTHRKGDGDGHRENCGWRKSNELWTPANESSSPFNEVKTDEILLQTTTKDMMQSHFKTDGQRRMRVTDSIEPIPNKLEHSQIEISWMK